jgi:hypothetical protein
MEEKPEAPRRNLLEFDPKEECLTIKIYFDEDQSICMALGSLQIAQDQVKMIGGKLRMMKRAKSPGLIIPGENGNGGLHEI